MNLRLAVLSQFLLLTCLSFAARADEPAIRKTLESYVEAFNKKDLKTVATYWTENATHTDRETGERTEGKKAIQADLATLFKEQPAAKLSGRVDRVRLIKPDVASIEGQTTLVNGGDEPSVSNFTAILVQDKDKWLIDSIDESPVPRATTSRDALQELEWLVGRWVDDDKESRVESTVRWTASESFLVRSFAVHTAEGADQQGTQIIGYDPRSQEIRSWTFNADGSFGDGVWSRSGDDWSIKSSQTLADGRAASGTYLLTHVDANTASLQLVGLV